MQMGLRNCKLCGQVFVSTSHKICPQCREEEEQDFLKVKEYIYDHGKRSIPEIHEGTEVSVKRIKKFIREGRLMETGVELTVECKRCGAPITEGDYCKECRDTLTNSLSQGNSKDKKEEPKRKSSRMHTSIWRDD